VKSQPSEDNQKRRGNAEGCAKAFLRRSGPVASLAWMGGGMRTTIEGRKSGRQHGAADEQCEKRRDGHGWPFGGGTCWKKPIEKKTEAQQHREN